MHPQDSTPPPRFCACGCGQLTPIASRTDHRSGAIQGQRVRFVLYHGGRPPTPVIPRFWSKVNHSDAAGCWLWAGTIQADGYGIFRLAGRNRRATHIAWELATGQSVTPDKMIGHTCDTPLCVRNDDDGWYEVNGVLLPRRGHLFLGTNAQNNADRNAKGRQARTGNPKLTAGNVLQIRHLYAAGGVSYARLGRQFGVAVETIAKIVTRRTWSHLPDA